MSLPTLRKGNPDTAANAVLQSMLKDLGHYTGQIDGDFGPQTEKAVLAFQAAANINMAGVVGPLTALSLEQFANSARIQKAGVAQSLEMRFQHAIITRAYEFVGLREVKPNADWDDPRTPLPDLRRAAKLRAAMRPAPWQEGWAYCAAFVEAIYIMALTDIGVEKAKIDHFAKIMQPGVMNSVRAFRELGILTTSLPPTNVAGAIWLARHGQTSQGHAGIIESAKGNINTIEANTSLDARDSDQKQREGDWITKRYRNFMQNGSLITQGIVTPAAILKLIGA